MSHRDSDRSESMVGYQQSPQAVVSASPDTDALRQAAFIENVVQTIAGLHDFSQIIGVVLDAAAQFTGADLVSLALETENGGCWVISQRYDGVSERLYLTLPQGMGMTGQVIQTGQMMLVADNRAAAGYVPPPTQREYRSSLTVPLARGQVVIGALSLESLSVGAFDDNHAAFVRSLGIHTVVSIHNARLMDELQYQIDTLTSLRALALRLSSVADSRTVAEAVLETAFKMVGGQYAILFQYVGDKLTALASVDAADPSSDETLADRVRQSAYTAIERGEPQVIQGKLPAAASLIAVPIIHSAAVAEALCVVFGSQQILPRDVNALSLLAIQAAGHFESAALDRKIRDGSDRLAAILDSARDGVILIDNNGHLAAANPSAERLLGCELSSHIGEPFVDVLTAHSDQQQDENAGYTRDQLEELSRLIRFEPKRITRRTFERRTASGEVIYIEETGSPVESKNNRISGRLLLLRDISEEKRLQSYRDDVTNMLIHDLRRPLASIISALRITRENLPDLETSTPVAAQMLTLAANRAGDMLTMVSGLLQIARLQNTQLDLDFDLIDVASLIESAHQVVLPGVYKAGVRMDFKIPPDLPLVNVDVAKIRRVLVNLLDNALRYTPSGERILVAAEAVPDARQVRVRVADSGPGIPEQEREHLFERYQQARSGRSSDTNFGLGLSFCKLAVEAHGGRIWIETESPLPGASFAFTLPTA